MYELHMPQINFHVLHVNLQLQKIEVHMAQFHLFFLHEHTQLEKEDNLTLQPSYKI